MANSLDRHPENTRGAWYVDSNCIGCELCADRAPEVFTPTSDASQNIVHHQPNTAEELQAAEEAQAACPVDAIQNDG